ncbi:glycoside hydrolase family 3 N-terminal domain-containing protein [Thomasclavelia cocleata]|uniref:glycoside hydrolase family 3 N-terminal domain-containing protein n=1 Tax=Thomasclavelia cocleata TaxID=69824 RepID=UPI00256FBCC4|nr:glycoside hydrolase family 3 N-terminal domain-containing protein [Thomasclavelia cocleata]
MKSLGKKKIISLIMVLFMVFTTIFSVQISNVSASENAEKAKALVSKMTLEEKIGQKIMLSFRSGWTMRDGTRISAVQNINDEIYEIIGKYDIGSVILFAANFNSDAKINVELTDGLQRAAMDETLGGNSIPLLIATDQEGGIVYRLTGGTALPGNMALGASGDIENAVKAGNIIGSELNAVGVNVNFAPDADVNNNPNNPVIGLRSFSSNPQLAARFVSAYIEGVQNNNVATAAKHFPGHGNVATDSHTGLPSVPATKEELYATELVPFQAAIDAGTDMVMTAHIQFPNIVTEEIYSDKKDELMSPPATLSREILTDLLRDEMNFDGVIVTDSMTMQGVADYFDTNERNLLAVKAGVDILDIPFTDMSSMADMESKLIPLINAFVDAYTKEDGYNGIKLSVEELDESVERILICKYNRGVMDLVNDTTTLEEKKAIASSVVGSVENRETERLISANAVTVVKNENNVLPLKLTSDSKVVFASTYSRNNNRFVLAWQRAKQAGIIPEGADYKILQHYNWTGLNDKVNSAINSDGTNFAGTNKDVLDWGTVLVHASEISSAGGIDGYLVACPQLFTQYCKDNGKQTVVISLNHPYDVQAFPNADGILAVYGTTSLGLDITESFGGGTVGATAAFSPNLTAGTEVVLGTFGATGKLPVDVPKYVPGSKVYSTDENVYELGYGIEYDSIVEDADKTALNEMIEKAKSLNEDEFTAESWNDAASVLSELKDLLKTAENVNLTHKLAQSVVDGAKTDLQGKYAEVLALLVPNNTNKTALEIAIEMAESASLENVVPAVVEEFNAALENAQTVYANARATQEEIDDAFTRLASVMHMLEFFKGNKELLQKQVDQINGLESNKYIESTWNAMLPVLEKANEVLGNENAMQEEVDEVYSELVRAFVNLRLKPNKDLLADLINKANGLNRANYTSESLKAVDAEVAKATAVLNNSEATKEEVESAQIALQSVLDKLVTKDVSNVQVPSSDVKVVNNGESSALKTGDNSMVVPFAFTGLLAFASGVIVFKKKKD